MRNAHGMAWVASILAFAAAATWPGCAGQAARGPWAAPAGSATSAAALSPADRVLVLPLRDGSCLPKSGNHVTCHLTGEHLDAGEVPAGTGLAIGQWIHDALVERGADVVPYERAVALFRAADPGEADRYEASLGVALGRLAGASKVLMGVVARYEERSGWAFASRTPAAVAFSVGGIDVASGTMVAKLRFNREQTPLSENLFALPRWWRQGFRWWTRREVAGEAARETAAFLTGGRSPEAWAPRQAGGGRQGMASDQSRSHRQP